MLSHSKADVLKICDYVVGGLDDFSVTRCFKSLRQHEIVGSTRQAHIHGGYVGMMDLKSKPFYLTDQDINGLTHVAAWTFRQNCQLFCLIVMSDDTSELLKTLRETEIKPGGFMSAISGRRSKQTTLFAGKFRDSLLLRQTWNAVEIVLHGWHVFWNTDAGRATDDEMMAYRLGWFAGGRARVGAIGRSLQ